MTVEYKFPFGRSWQEQLDWFQRQQATYSKDRKKIPLTHQWPASHLDQYLIALARGQNFVEHVDSFPRYLRPGEWLYGLFNILRDKTKDGLERHIDILIDPDSQKIHIPPIVAKGKASYVPSATISEHRKKWTEGEKYQVVGSMHSHPHADMFSLERLSRKFFLKGHLSAGDLYIAVKDNSPEYFMGVANDENNMLVFRTQETNGRSVMSYLPKGKYTKQDRFSKFWYGRRGIKYNPKNNTAWKAGGKTVTDAELWQVNLDIAEWHHLALYVGRPKFHFTRVNPPQPK